MDRCDENNPALMKRMNYGCNAMEGAKFTTKIGNNRRVLRDINNFVATAPFPSAVTKRGLSEKPCIEEKNKHTLGHRPITRRFAASLASKQPCKEDPSVRAKAFENEKHKKPIALAPNSNGSESHAVTDLDEDMEVSDCLLPIHVKQKDTAHCPLPLHPKQTTAMVEEIEPMNNPELEEVEMEDLEEVEPIPDVDSLDKKNSLAVVEYVEDIYSFYRQTEVSSCVHPNYMCNQPDINEKMRAILIDWLIEVHYKFELMDETLFLTVNLIDRFLERQSIVRKKLQLVGVTAMLLACKYEEVSVPVVEDLILISDRAYTREEILAMEKLMANTLKFYMSVPTPYVFMRRFLKVAQFDKKLELLSFFMIELCLVEYDMLKYSPSLLAAAAVYTAKCTLQGYRNWSRASEWHSKYTEDQLLECSRLMVDFHQKAASGKLTGVHRKYNTFKFGYAARAAPARFLSDTRN